MSAKRRKKAQRKIGFRSYIKNLEILYGISTLFIFLFLRMHLCGPDNICMDLIVVELRSFLF
ncbi:hypothetical protein PAHAL_9G318300 [Panicum hallii]|jgi:hypothetical protein|uniref:MADS-box domain-containing protein n=1 Tax=Panicum hallii TaxID=206008 RepID=A0A2T8I399_9POAL|nr:hypothetical protein PAHAL_9G318300 [Panicum hallii]